MAALIGYLDYGHHAGVIHRLAHDVIISRLETWDVSIQTWLDKEGNYRVTATPKYGGREFLVGEGNLKQKLEVK